MPGTFLTAAWRQLAMLNFEIDPKLLASRVPNGCEIDFFEGRTFVSLVGFLFQDVKVLGVPIPFHRNFEEVNLRFYVKRKGENGAWRHGVVFVKELAPRWAVAFLANNIFGEHYESVPMRHKITGDQLAYQWKRGGVWEGIEVRAEGDAYTALKDSEPSFISESYWGYTAWESGATAEYEVIHPVWRLRNIADYQLNADFDSLYGPELAAPLRQKPSSAFVADGSPVTVGKVQILR
jgi:uncharacterized protein YqjF (DUF2071 family)